MQVTRPCFRNDRGDIAVCKNSALVQNDEVVARFDLVEKVRGPQHAYALLDDEPLHVAEDLGSRLDVQPDRRLIEQ